GPGQAAVVEHLLQATQHGRRAVRTDENVVHEVRAGDVDLILGDRLASMAEQVLGLVAEQLLDLGNCGCRHDETLFLLLMVYGSTLGESLCAIILRDDRASRQASPRPIIIELR